MTRISQRKKLPPLEKFFENSYISSWFFKVSEAFSSALDISSTQSGATMGSCFTFEIGDIFYDNQKAYKLDWQNTKDNVRYCVQILESTPSSIVVEEVDELGKITKVKKIVDGVIVFELRDLSKKENQALKISTNQFEFVEFLQTGKIRNLTNSQIIDLSKI